MVSMVPYAFHMLFQWFLCFAYAFPMSFYAFLWFLCFPMFSMLSYAFLCFSYCFYAFPMLVPCFPMLFLCFPMVFYVFPWFCYAFPMAPMLFLCFSYGFYAFPMLFLCLSYAFPMLFLCFALLACPRLRKKWSHEEKGCRPAVRIEKIKKRWPADWEKSGLPHIKRKITELRKSGRSEFSDWLKQ